MWQEFPKPTFRCPASPHGPNTCLIKVRFTQGIHLTSFPYSGLSISHSIARRSFAAFTLRLHMLLSLDSFLAPHAILPSTIALHRCAFNVQLGPVYATRSRVLPMAFCSSIQAHFLEISHPGCLAVIAFYGDVSLVIDIRMAGVERR